ncbi:putative quinol monooxygenase [Sphingomonas oleivorans]|nr:antibiotic biosynthesis monooxygenase family protein [Sphingomonas oleivorans]
MARRMIATFEIAEGKEEETLSIVRELTRHVRNEPGNLALVPHREADHPERITIYEAYVDDAAFQRHLDADYVRSFNDRLKNCARGGSSIVVQLDEIPL